MLLPRSSYAVEMNPLVISDSFRASLVQLITLLQRLQALNLQKPPVFGNSLPKIESPTVQNPPTSTTAIPTSQQALPFIEGFSLPTPPPRSKILRIDSISPTSGPKGTTIILNGQFPKGTPITLYTSYSVEKVTSSDGKTLSVYIIPPFDYSFVEVHGTERYSLYLEDSSGISNEGLFILTY